MKKDNFNEQIEKILPKREPLDKRNFFQRNGRLLLIIGLILIVLYIGANIYVHQALPVVYQKALDPNQAEFNTPSPTPTVLPESFEGVPCGGATVLNNALQIYLILPTIIYLKSFFSSVLV